MPFRYPPHIKSSAIQLVEAGVGVVEASREVGVGKTSLYKWLHDAGIALRTSRLVSSCPGCAAGLPDGGWQSDYAYLLGLYLGDGFVREQIRGSAVLSIACADAWPGLRQECVVAMRAVLPVTVRTTPSQGCSYVESASDHWRCLFPQHGRGRKHERRITLEDWQWYVGVRHTGRLVRGLFHSDGWRGQNVAVHRDGRRYRYPRYEFTNKSDDIMRICQDALTRLDIPWRMSGRYRLSVARREAVIRLDDYVGPKY